MQIKQDKQNEFHILEIAGEIDLNNSMDLKKVFGTLLGQKVNKVMIDLKSVEFIDSSGLATLVEFMQNLDDIDGEMFLVGVNEKVIGIIEITKLDKVFSIHSTRDEVFEL